MEQYDFVIVGSGLGGLTCGAILSKKGYRVCILEKNPVVGGCLISYNRKGGTYETGVHYLGSLDKGEILNKLFNYLEIMELVEFERLSMSGFDAFSFGENPELFRIPQGYPLFIKTLSERFPLEKEGIEHYCQCLISTSHKFPLYTFKASDFEDKMALLYANAYETICSFVKDPTLRAILAGNNPLYAGVAEKTPFYTHALIENSFIESSWRVKSGGSSIAKALVKRIKENGGVIKVNAEVVSFAEEGDSIMKAVTKNGDEFYAKNFISSLHPAVTLSLSKSARFRPAYRHRIAGLENTTSPFTISVKYKPNSFPFLNYNHYHYTNSDVWAAVQYSPEEWPKGFALFTSTQYEGTDMAKTGFIMTYMNFADVKKWEDTYNTVYKPGHRGENYEKFKSEKATQLLHLVEIKYPGYIDTIEDFHVSTPLTYRDYFGSPEGSLYGVLKDSNEPMRTYFPTRTKIPNLFLTGQNMSVHGVLGVAISAIITCGEFVGLDLILNEVKES